MSGKFINYRKCEGCKFESEEELIKAFFEYGLIGSDEKNNLEIICSYMDKIDNEFKERKFDSFTFFGKWIADNVEGIKLIDVVQLEE